MDTRGRLLRALSRSALLRLVKLYRVAVGPGFVDTGEVIRRLESCEALDPLEALSALRDDELAAVAPSLGVVPVVGRQQLLRRLASALRWRPFAAAREHARTLGLTTAKAWGAWTRSRRAPADLPAAPDRVYRGKGWAGWGDFLGTGNKGRHDYHHRPFVEARAFVRALGLRSSEGWVAWCRGERPDLPPRPEDIPTNPHRTYRTAWQGVGDWLGTGTVATQRRQYHPFGEARRLVRAMGFSNQVEYFAWRRAASPRLAGPFPGRPATAYRRQWRGWGDFLGTGRVAPSVARAWFLPFRQARAFVRRLGLRSLAEWRLWAKGALPGKTRRPIGVPTNPEKVYRGRGWVGVGDWLGTGTLAPGAVPAWPFAKARAFTRGLGLRSQAEWNEWRAGRLPGAPPRPSGVPTNPNRTYPDQWVSWADWLGKPTGKRRRWRPFQEARAFARELGLTSAKEWKAYAAGRRPELPARPGDVPASPGPIYAGSGWAGYHDWLGCDA